MEFNNFKISVIVPVYNAGNYLNRTILSVLNQTYKNFELIIINDGSTDCSLNILEQIINRDSRIVVLTQDNKGVTAARKLGWSIATGDYITFLDADDSFYTNSLEILVNELYEDDYDIINGSFVSVPSGRKWIHEDIKIMNSVEYLKSIIFNKTYLAIYASLYKKSIFHSNSFEFDRNLKIGEDVLVNIEIGSRVKKVKNINNIVYKYTDNNEKSAMTIIERHPNYYKRFFLIRDELYRLYNYDIFKKYQSLIENRNNTIIVKSFFSSHIDFDKSLYSELRSLRFGGLIWNFYTICLRNGQFTRLVKFVIKVSCGIKYLLKNQRIVKVILK
jgi:glycosyltransferase involved in cell wall biosynthesis